MLSSVQFIHKTVQIQVQSLNTMGICEMGHPGELSELENGVQTLSKIGDSI